MSLRSPTLDPESNVVVNWSRLSLEVCSQICRDLARRTSPYVAIVIGSRTQVRTTKDIQANEADILVSVTGLESLWNIARSFRGVRLQNKCCCPLHCWLRSGPRTQRMSLTRCCSRASRKCRLIWTVTRLFDSPFDPAVDRTESIVAACSHNHAEIKADVDTQVLSHAERGIRCLGIASSDADGKWVFRGESHVFRSAAT